VKWKGEGLFSAGLNRTGLRDGVICCYHASAAVWSSY